MDRLEIDVIVGNVDLWVTRRGRIPKPVPPPEWMFRMMEMTRDRLNDSQIEWPDKRPFSMTHTPDRT